METFDKFISILNSLEKNKVDYVLIGGFALILQGIFRATQDIDLFIRNESENIELLRKSLFENFNDDSINEITSEELSKYPVIRFGTELGFSIDILVNIGEEFKFEDIEYELITLDNLNVRVVTPETLYKLKEKTYREIDKHDLIFLKKIIEERNANKKV